MTCLKLWPGSECGLHGSCLSENGTSFCECDEGWEQTLEFNYFANKDNSGLCNIHAPSLTFLYSALLVVGLVSLLYMFRSVKNSNFTKRKVIKRIPNIAASFLAVVMGTQRLIDTKAVFGEDPFFTLCLLTALFINIYLIESYLNRYLKYVAIKPDWIEELHFVRVKKIVRLAHKLHNFSLITISLVFVVWYFNVIFASQIVAFITTRTSLIIIIVLVIAKDQFIVTTTLTILIGDMRALAAISEDNSEDNATYNDKISRYVEIKLPQYTTMRRVIGIFQFTEIMFLGFVVSIDYLLVSTMSYFFPLYFLLILMLNGFTIFLANRKKAKLRTTAGTLSKTKFNSNPAPALTALSSSSKKTTTATSEKSI